MKQRLGHVSDIGPSLTSCCTKKCIFYYPGTGQSSLPTTASPGPWKGSCRFAFQFFVNHFSMFTMILNNIQRNLCRKIQGLNF